MRTVFFLFTIFNPVFLLAQGYGNTMVFGYEGGHFSPNNDEYGLNILTFNNGGLEISDNQESDLEFNDTDAAISDENGNLLFYFNGVSIYDAVQHVMENGDTLNAFNQFGYDLPQGAVIVPYPEKPNQFILFHAEEGYVEPPTWGQEVVGLYYSVIDMAQNNGLGKVVQRKTPLLIDTLEYGKLDVVRHANGRDWWLGVWESHSNKYYKVLIDPYGIHILGKSAVGTPRHEGIGQAYFSPDGTKYVVFSAIVYNGEYHYLDIYDFDRCTGTYSNHEQFHIPIPVFGGGGIISPNSRWLYVSFSDYLYKYDLWANPVEPTGQLIATYEPFNDPFPTKFAGGFLAPDDKVYFVTSSGSRTLHVVHKPDEPGTDCAFQQHGIRLACYNANSIPTFANYRLGPKDGSSCDSLGIDNVPVSWWRYEQDTVQHARFEFRDLSFHEPTTWLWDFGDGSTSTERHPIHEYAASGGYQACLTVSNANGSNTLCRSLSATVATENLEIANRIQVTPNPFRSHLRVALSAALRSPIFHLYDQLGYLLRQEPLALGITEIETSTLQPGMYFWDVVSNGVRTKAGKIIKTER